MSPTEGERSTSAHCPNGLIDLDTISPWAKEFILGLQRFDVIAGQPDCRFLGIRAVTRGELATMLIKPTVFGGCAQHRPAPDFSDTSGHWARAAITKAYRCGVLSGDPPEWPGASQRFRPDDSVTREEVIVALATGLHLNVPLALRRDFLEYFADELRYWPDPVQRPWSLGKVIGAARAGLVVNWPSPIWLAHDFTANRAETAAMIYQVLVYRGQAPAIDSPYIAVPR